MLDLLFTFSRASDTQLTGGFKNGMIGICFAQSGCRAKRILSAGMPGRITQMGREEFAELVQSSIQDCQVRTSNHCCRMSMDL